MGVGEEIGKVDELLGIMGEARNDMEKEKKAFAAAQEEREPRKIKLGKELVARSLMWKCFDSEEGTKGDGQEETEDGEGQGRMEPRTMAKRKPKRAKARGAREKKRRKSVARAGAALEADQESFGVALHHSDMARLEVDKERLVVELDRARSNCSISKRSSASR